jgi:hypothetical protein
MSDAYMKGFMSLTEQAKDVAKQLVQDLKRTKTEGNPLTRWLWLFDGEDSWKVQYTVELRSKE